MISPSERILARTDGFIGWMIFNNPEHNNALSLDMWQAMGAVLDHYGSMPEVRVIVVCGAGDKAFASGADISEFDQVRSTPEQIESYNRTAGFASAKLAAIGKPTIAMIRGWCLGGGVAIALACDLRIASAQARFSIPAARLGLGYGWPGVKMIIDLAGPACAKEILFTGRHFSASEAQAMGLINRSVPDSELESDVRSYCDMIGANAPLTIRAAKGVIAELVKPAGKADYAHCEALVNSCSESEDYIEGRRAFLEKRKPVFKGK